MRTAVFLDRDGVVNQLVPDPFSGQPESPLRPADVVLVPGAAEGARRLRDAGYLLVGVSNQPAAAKGNADLATLESVQGRVLELLAEQGVKFDDFRICWHHPEAVVPALSKRCDCRKPAPGMLLASAEALGIDLRRSWMIGDTDADILAGAAAGSLTVLVEHPASGHKRGTGVAPDLIAPDLIAAAEQLLGPRSR